MSISAPVSPPPLRDGDRLTSEEFLRRWEAMPDLKRAELIDGIVYMPSPVSGKHSDFHSLLFGWLSRYEFSSPGCEAGTEATWVMGKGDTPSPDITLRISPECGGQSHDERGYRAGAPELIAEVSVTSRARDLGVKLQLYERMGVREYLVAVASQSKLIWHEWADGHFQVIEPHPDGILRSRSFPGLWLDPAAFWRRDKSRLVAVLDDGLASPEHAAFVAQLSKNKG